jgi:hypothetical protein
MMKVNQIAHLEPPDAQGMRFTTLPPLAVKGKREPLTVHAAERRGGSAGPPASREEQSR